MAEDLDLIKCKEKLTNIKMRTRGRKARRTVTKPNLKFILDAVGTARIARELKISLPRISNWLYTDVSVPRQYAKFFAAMTQDLFSAKEINKKINHKDYVGNMGIELAIVSGDVLSPQKAMGKDMIDKTSK